MLGYLGVFGACWVIWVLLVHAGLFGCFWCMLGYLCVFGACWVIQVLLVHAGLFGCFWCMLGYLGVSIIHQILTWTTCVCDLSCMCTHRGPGVIDF